MHVDHAASSRPTSAAVGDFDKDGKLDLAITNSFASTVSVFLGKGDGTFRPRVDYATDINPQWLAVAGFNGDGELDIATANYGPDYSGGSASIFLGNGDGSFASQRTYPAGVNSFGVITRDFNRDGKLGLAVVNNNGSYGVLILVGNGDGSFQSPVFYATGMNPRVGVVADLNPMAILTSRSRTAPRICEPATASTEREVHSSALSVSLTNRNTIAISVPQARFSTMGGELIGIAPSTTLEPANVVVRARSKPNAPAPLFGL